MFSIGTFVANGTFGTIETFVAIGTFAIGTFVANGTFGTIETFVAIVTFEAIWNKICKSADDTPQLSNS